MQYKFPVVNITYPRLGICTFINGKYVRYVCYNTKILNVIKDTKYISSKNYHSINKIINDHTFTIVH